MDIQSCVILSSIVTEFQSFQWEICSLSVITFTSQSKVHNMLCIVNIKFIAAVASHIRKINCRLHCCIITYFCYIKSNCIYNGDHLNRSHILLNICYHLPISDPMLSDPSSNLSSKVCACHISRREFRNTVMWCFFRSSCSLINGFKSFERRRRHGFTPYTFN
jgi:hypothetical protein